MKDIVRKLTPIELLDIRKREQQEGSPYSDRDMLLDHIDALEQEYGEVEALRAEYANPENYILAATHAVIVGRAYEREEQLRARIEVLEAELARDPFVRDGWQTPRADRIRALLSDAMRQQIQPPDVKQ
jgi:hypothetical protein